MAITEKSLAGMSPEELLDQYDSNRRLAEVVPPGPIEYIEDERDVVTDEMVRGAEADAALIRAEILRCMKRHSGGSQIIY